jgi:DNA-binding NtrC family response regulator
MLSITYQAHSVEQKLLQVFVNDAHEVRLKVLKENELVMEDYTMLSKPETISHEIIKASAELEGQSLAERFKKKTLELAREGYFGSLRTHHSQLQNSYANLIHLLDQSHIPILIFGETGAGKRRLVDEYFVLHNFYRRLDNLKQGQLRVYKSDFLSSGWTEFLTPKHNTSADLIYLENIEDLHKDRQRELLQFLKDRKKKAQTLQEVPRIVLGTEKALSLLVMQDKFIRELFYEITTFSIFLPSLQERSEDILCLIQ